MLARGAVKLRAFKKTPPPSVSLAHLASLLAAPAVGLCLMDSAEALGCSRLRNKPNPPGETPCLPTVSTPSSTRPGARSP